FAHRKELIRGDLLFDDAPHNLEAFAPYGVPVAMAYPYNETVPYTRVRDWPEFLALVDRLFPAAKPARGPRAGAALEPPLPFVYAGSTLNQLPRRRPAPLWKGVCSPWRSPKRR